MSAAPVTWDESTDRTIEVLLTSALIATAAMTPERGLELPPSPIVEINNQLAKLLDISRQQAELSAALTQTSQAALGQAISSGEHAKRATWLAVAAILVAIMLGGVSTYTTINSRAAPRDISIH
jgi:hypothetical protein